MERRAVVAGATGLVGGELARILLGMKNYSRITLLVRTKKNMAHPRLEQLVIDFETLSGLPEELMKGADVYCTLGTTRRKAGSKEAFRRVDYHYPMELGRLARKSGAARFLIVTAAGSGTGSPFFYSRVKGEVERDLGALNLNALHIFKPSLILGNRQEHRSGEMAAAALAKNAPILFKGPFAKHKPIQAAEIARAMVATALLQEPASHRVVVNHEMPQLAALLHKIRS